MRIVLELNKMVISQADLDAIVGSFMVPSDNLLPLHRKSAKRKHRRKDRVRVTTLIDTLIDEITEG